MDTLEFIAEMIKALAWPMAAVAVALIFRKSIIELLGRINKGKLGWAELEFETQVAEAAKTISIAEVRPESPQPPPAEASTDPGGTVLNAWRDVDEALREFAQKKRLIYASTLLQPFSAVDALREEKALEPQYIALLEHLGELRNQAAHQKDFVPSSDSVALYLKLAEAFKAALLKASV